MHQTAVVYWSGTGNTEAMAKAVADAAIAGGASCSLFAAPEFQASMMDDYDAIAFGCPSMGAEELEEDEFAPMFEDCKAKLTGKRIALFGSYGWGDGEWMRSWSQTCRDAGAELCCEPVICCGYPDEEALNACEALGKTLAG
ncbi:MAG: flavodoxin [Clostridia bacterium]|nr:flavodoxin [Clostridia bacterium]